MNEDVILIVVPSPSLPRRILRRIRRWLMPATVGELLAQVNREAKDN